MFRFLHSSDLHLGKRFGNFAGDLPSRLREARHGTLKRLAEQAKAHDAKTILLAGDTFDTETPAPEVRRQALMEMGQHTDLTWVILPGNHDSLQATELWSRLTAECPANVILAIDPSPIEIAPKVVILPAPCTTRRPGRDLTEWMSAIDLAPDRFRIGLAHGAIQNFTEDSATHDVIAPDRAQLSKLDYLALGDWHGTMRVNERTYYSGTPEPDRFKHNRPGEALLVTLTTPGAAPQVTPVRVGSFDWQTLDLRLLSSEDPVARLNTSLPEAYARRQCLTKVTASGHTSLSNQSQLLALGEDIAPDFAWFELNTEALRIDYAPEDLDTIELTGALRTAADTLLRELQDERLAATDRAIAASALSRLYRHLQGAAQ